MTASVPMAVHRSMVLLIGLALALGALVPMATPPSAHGASTSLVISQVYGGGGNSGATYTNDYIEIFNRGTTTVDVSTWSVQYASAGGTTWQVTSLTGSIPPGDYYLVQEAQGANGTTALPTPDATGAIPMSATAGKVALLSSQTMLVGCGSLAVPCQPNAAIVDFVGYGSTATEYEGAGPAPTLTNTAAALRASDGATDSDDNATDFVSGTPNPRNSNFGGEDPEPTEIHEIQGAAHTSPLVNQDVFEVEGIVTAVRPLSFYMTDPTPDSDDATSDGILVFANAAPAVAVGDRVLVNGHVTEFRPGGSGSANLTTTEITTPGLSVVVVESGIALPVTTVGTGGRVPPNVVIDNDSVGGSVENAGGTFDPAQDGIDFWESLEGQFLRVNDAIAVGPTNGFGEIPVVGDNRANAGVQTSGGGILIGPNDFNPERVILDDAIVGSLAMPKLNVGDGFTTPVIGVLDYDFGNFKLLVTTTLVRDDNGLTQEVTASPANRELSIATFNVENLDPNPSDSDGADNVARHGALIATNMAAPDILAIEEVQDNNGTVNDGTVAADLTWASLIDAIEDAGGPTYEYRQIDPVNNADGGAPGGNIRVGFLYRTDRGLTFVDRPGGTSLVDTQVVANDARPQLTFSPGRVGTDARAFNSTRKSLAGEFRWRGQTVFVIVNHFSSKNGDQPIFGRFQPPVRVTEVASPDEATDPDGWRHGQAAEVNDFVNQILAIDRKANIVVLGDINDFQFSETVDILTGADEGTPVLTTLFDLLPAGEQYSYVFEGNSQVLDQILVSTTVLQQGPVYDVVHVNSEFFEQASDHEPSVMRFVPGRGEHAGGN